MESNCEVLTSSTSFQGLNDANQTSRITTTGKVLLGITGTLALGLTIISAPFISPALRKFCLPYIPATPAQIANIRAALKGCKGSLLDIGSGDGRIVISMAKDDFIAHGVELNPWLVIYSKMAAWKSGLSAKTRFYRRDLWKFHLGGYDNIVIFGVEQMMVDLEHKFQRECKENSKIFACRFPLPNTSPVATYGVGIDAVWVYNIKKKQVI